MGKIRFIDKTNSTTFQLVHRSQDDQRINDEDASDLVLKKIQKSGNITRKQLDDNNNEDDTQLDHDDQISNYGVYFDDDYDYLKHMRSIGDGHFVATKENTQKPNNLELLEGLQPNMHPDLREVLQALDDDAYIEPDEDTYFESINSENLPKDYKQHFEVEKEDLDNPWLSEFKKFQKSKGLIY
jgi:protein LTV1